MQHPNRGKRSVGIDLAQPEGVELLYELAKSCDVFLTNYLPSLRQKLKIDVEHIRAANPDIIYVRGSAHGDKGPDRDKGGFDSTAYWARGGSSLLVTPHELEGPLLLPGPAYGDSIGGMFIAGGIAAALFHRKNTGEATEVDVSLLSTGIWATSCSIDIALEVGHVPFRNQMPKAAAAATNPFAGNFRTSDGRTINLSMLKPGPYIRDTFEHLGLAELADDPRFSTAETLMANASAAGAYIIEAFAKQPFGYWMERLKTMAGPWAAHQSVLEAGSDPQVLANDLIFEVEAGDDSGRPMKLVASPVQFDHAPITNTRAPEASEHTETVLMELGIDWDRLMALKDKGAIA
jgi:crotonobetainyl-CoA:carnitine CoA-transferase CaiB-like acyl-CoA transferase